MLDEAAVSGIYRPFCLEVNPGGHRYRFGTAAKTEVTQFIVQWYKTEPVQGSCSKELRRSTSLNCSPVRIAPVTFSKSFSVSKGVLELPVISGITGHYPHVQ